MELRPNLKATVEFALGCCGIAASLLFVVVTPKLDLFEVRSGNKTLTVPEFIRADKFPQIAPTKKIKSCFLPLGILFAGGAVGGAIYICLVANKRILVLDAEAAQYELDKQLRKLDDEASLQRRRDMNAADSEANLLIYKKELAEDFAMYADEKGWDFEDTISLPDRQILSLPQAEIEQRSTTPTDTMVAPTYETTVYNPVDNVICSGCLVWGNQGAGKSWFVRYLVREKLKRGYRVIVFDPNSNKTGWQGVELYNTYSEIARMMRWYVEEVQREYEEFCQSNLDESVWVEQIWASGKAISVICEEATTYEDFIEDDELLATFYKTGLTLARKPQKPLTIVVHNNTQGCLGSRLKHMGNIIRRTQQIQLLTKTHPVTKQPTASGKALIKVDSSEEWIEIETPTITEKIVDFTPYVKPNLQMYGVADSPGINLQKTDSPGKPEIVELLSDKLSEVVWTVRSVSDAYPESSPEQLFASVLEATQNGESVRNIIKDILKCREGNDHRTRAYSRHGKTLLRWLIQNYDDGELAKHQQIKDFLRG